MSFIVYRVALGRAADRAARPAARDAPRPSLPSDLREPMPTVLLLRHGLTAMTGPVLAGRTPAVHLDERGQAQAAAVAERLAVLPLTTVLTSPLERCAETARAVTRAQKAAGRTVPQRSDRRLLECDYGDWTGRKIKSLVKDPLWPVVQAHPSGVTFPGGESMAAMAERAVRAVRDVDARLAAGARRRRALGGLQPRRRDQGDPGRRAGPAPGPVPAAGGRSVLGVGDPVHRRTAVRPVHERHHRRAQPVRAAAAAESRCSPSTSRILGCDRRRWCRRRRRLG